eukprot:COSAG02_NODE_945_length_15722_cov_74.792357_3_plen_1022_part_00
MATDPSHPGVNEAGGGAARAGDAPLQFVKPAVVHRKSELVLAPRPPTGRTERKRRQEEVRQLRREDSARASAFGAARRRQLQLEKNAAQVAADFRLIKQQRSNADTKARNAGATERAAEQEEQLIAETRARAREVAASTADRQAFFAAQMVARREETVKEVRSQMVAARVARQEAGAVSVATRSTRAEIVRSQTELETARLAEQSLRYKQHCEERAAYQHIREQRHAAKASARHARMKAQQTERKKVCEEAAAKRHEHLREEKLQADFLLCKSELAQNHHLSREAKGRQLVRQNPDGTRDGKSADSAALTSIRRPVSARPVSAKSDGSLNGWGVITTQPENGNSTAAGHVARQRQQQQQQQQHQHQHQHHQHQHHQPVVREEEQQHVAVQRQWSPANVEHNSKSEMELESEFEPDPEAKMEPELQLELDPVHASKFAPHSPPGARTGRFNPNTSLQAEGSVEGSWLGTVGLNPNVHATLLRAATRETSQAKSRAAVHFARAQSRNTTGTCWRGWNRAQKQLPSANGRRVEGYNPVDINKNEAGKSTTLTPWPAHADSFSELSDAYGYGNGQVSPLATETREGIKHVPIPRSAALAVRDIVKGQANEPSVENSCLHSSGSSLSSSGAAEVLQGDLPTLELEHGSNGPASDSEGTAQTQNRPSPEVESALAKTSADAAEQACHDRIMPPAISVDEGVTVATTPRQLLLALPAPMRPRANLLADGPLLDRTRIVMTKEITNRSDTVRADSCSKRQRWRHSGIQPTKISEIENSNRPGSAREAEPEGTLNSLSGPMRPWSARDERSGADDLDTERSSSLSGDELHSSLQCRAAVVEQASHATTKTAVEKPRLRSNRSRDSNLKPQRGISGCESYLGARSTTDSPTAAPPAGNRSRRRPRISNQLLHAPYAADRTVVDVSLAEAESWPALPTEQFSELQRGSIHSLHVGSERPTTCSINLTRTRRKEQVLTSKQKLASTTILSSSSDFFKSWDTEGAQTLSEPPMMLQGVTQGTYVNLRNAGVTVC